MPLTHKPINNQQTLFFYQRFMEQVMASSPVLNPIWSILNPTKSSGGGGGGGGHTSHNLRDTVLSVLIPILIFNLASTLKLFPEDIFTLFLDRLREFFHQEINIKIPESNTDFRSDDDSIGVDSATSCSMYSSAEMYLMSTIALANKSNSRSTTLLRASTDSHRRNAVLTVDNSQVITDTFCSKGQNRVIVVKWKFHREQQQQQPPEGRSNSSSVIVPEKKYFILSFNSRKCGLDTVQEYLKHVMDTCEEIQSRNRQLWLHSHGTFLYSWEMAAFDHPASFDRLAMDPAEKKKIVDDLDAFSSSGEYYKKIGKAWKRGYLLYGPPGTGKSTMIACIANYLKYDVYDLELTAVESNTQLRQLTMNLSSKAILVIEDIDCSLDLSGARKLGTRKAKKAKGDVMNGPVANPESKVTLSGLLNCIDGLWSNSGGERIVIFMTNHIDKLDPALIRKGRMDVQVELGYCRFEAFKVLARNYLGVEAHPLFGRVEELMKEVEITPADAAEQLMPKSIAVTEEKVGECLEELIDRMEQMMSCRKTSRLPYKITV